jgi:NitT/TauT family transport system permease protein
MKEITLQLIFYLSLILVWQILVGILDVPEYLFPSPLDVADQFKSNFFILLENTGVTIFETLIGFILGVVFALLVALAIVHSRILEILIYPALIFSQTTPRIAIAPLLVIWFGYDILPKIIIVIIISFFTIVVNTVKGLKSADPELLNLMNSYGASKKEILIKVKLPIALPYIFAALKIAITLSVIGAVVGEFVGADKGLGYLIMLGNVNLDTSLMFSAIIILGIMGTLLYKIVCMAEKRIMYWSPS